jgi:hypothetical protein
MVIVNSPWMCGDVLEHFAEGRKPPHYRLMAAGPGSLNVIARSKATKQSSFVNRKKDGLLRSARNDAG